MCNEMDDNWESTKVAGIVYEIFKNMDSFGESMDLYHIMVLNPDSKKVRSVPYKMNTGFLSYPGPQILT
jgi:hypothetical protein